MFRKKETEGKEEGKRKKRESPRWSKEGRFVRSLSALSCKDRRIFKKLAVAFSWLSVVFIIIPSYLHKNEFLLWSAFKSSKSTTDII